MSDPEFNPDDFLAAPEQQAEFDPDAFIGQAPTAPTRADGFGELTPLPALANQPDEFDKMMPGGFETDLVSPTATRFARTYVQAPPEDLSAYPKTKDAVERESRISGLAKAAHAIGAGFDQATTWLAKKLTEASPEEAQALGEFAKQQQEMGSFLPSAVTGESLREALGGLAAIDVTPKKVLQLDNAEAARIRGEGAFAIAAQRNIEAQRQLQASELSFQEAMAAVEGRLVPDITAQREELEAQLPLDLREEGVAGVLADITSGSESTLQAAAEGAKVAGPGVAIGLVAGAVTKNPALARTVVMNSAKFGGLAGAANFTFRQEAGSTFKETADWKGSDGKPLSLQERAGAAIVTGLVNTGIEIGSDLIALYKLEPALAAVAGGESSLRAQVARDPRLRAMLVRAAKTWVQASTPEVLEEGAQAVAGQAVHAAVSQDLSVFSPSEAVDAMGQSIVPMFLGVGVVGPVLHVAAESSLRHEYQKAGQRVAPLLQLAADADMQASPAEFVAVAEKVGAGPVYVRGEAVKRFFQERSEDVGEQQRQLEEALGPGAVEKVETAAATGGSVEISLEALPQWAKHEASGALVDDSSTHPEAPTPRELRAGGAAVEEAAQKLASEELAKHADGLAFEKVVDRWVVEQVAAGQPKGQAKVAAMVLRHLVATAAKDSGKSPMEIARSAEFHFLPGDEQPMPAQAPTAPDIETFLTNRLQSQDPMAEAGKAALVKDFFIDAATGVRNRRFWDLEKKTAVAVGIISIEGVKFQNDKFGHQAGDALYAAAAQALAQSGLDNGTLSRPGGDFAIANVTQEQLDAALERANLNPVLRGYRLSGHVAQTHEQTPEKDLTRVAAEKHNAAKKALEEAGQRALRGAKPLGAVDEAQMQARPVEGSVVSEARTADLLALDQEQQFQQQYTEPATGLLTKDARDRYLSAHPKKYHVSLDLNLLKAYNELIGDAGGDALIEAYGKLITELGGREFLATHVSGDEYTLDTDDLEGAQAFLEVLRNAAENHDIKVTLKDGSTGLVPGVTFGVGVGPTIDLAEEQLNADKERLAVEGKRGRDFEWSLAIAGKNLARGSDLLARRSGEGGTGAQGTAGVVSGTQEAGAAEAPAVKGRLAQVATEEDKATTPNQKIIARVEEILREYLMVEGIPGIESSQADEVRFNHDDKDLSDPLISVLQFPNPELPKTAANSLMRDVRLSRIVQAIGQPNLARDSALYVQALRNESERERATEEWSRESKVFEAWKSLDPIHPGWLLVLDHEAVLVRPGMDDVLFANADAADQAWAAEPIRSVDVEKTEWKDGYLEDKQNIPNKQVELTPRWYQDENTGEVPKGYFDGAEQVATGQVLRVFLNKSADISTTLHEVSHAWLEFYRQLATAADATDAVKKKYAAIETWLGVEAGAEFTKAQHEKFARTFEQYLLEGKAPKAGLERAFNSIKRWMLAIYRTARGVPGADLNEQSRRVFDALLATQDEVEAYQRAQGLADQKKPATVTAEEWQAQLEAQRDAVSEGSRKAELRAVKDALRVHERWWKDGVKKLRKVFADEYQQLPGVRAARFLRDAKLKLDPFDLPDNAGQIADTLGFASIDDLVRALAEIPDEKTWVEEHAEDEMRQQHPGILERRDDMRAAVAEGLNAYTEKRLLDERANLRKHDPRIGAAPIAMLRRAAELIVARTTLAKLNAGLALAREAKAAKEAYEAAAKGKWADAAKANQQQLLNHFLYRELMAARDLRTNLENTAAKASKKASRERLGKASEHYRNAVDFILGKLVLAAPIDGLDSGTLQQVAGQLQGDAVVVGDPEWLPDLIEATRADTYKDLTVAQGLAVLDALTQIQHAARMRTEATVEGKKIDEDELAAHLVNEAKSNKRQQGLLPSSPSAATFAQRLAGMPDAFSAPLLKIETMVDWLGGALVGKDPQSSWWYKAVFKPLEAARQRESDLFKSRLKPIDAAMNAIPKSVRKTWMDPIDGAQLFPQHKAGDVAPPSRRFELLVMALNAGTPSSLERLTLGRSITVDQVQAALGLLTKEEIDWVNAVGEAFDGMWPEIAAMEERVTGLRPQALERRAMVLRNGVLDGHYFPAIYDSRATVAGEKQDESKVAALFEGGFSGFGTQHGHTKARVDGFYAAISLEPGAIMTHLAQAVHDLAFREPVMEVGRRILRSEVNDALKSSLGIERAKQFRLWAKDAALGSVRSSEHAGALLKFARKLKANTTIAALGYSVPNFFEDMSALPSALADRELEAPSLMRGLKTFLSNPMQALDEVRRISPVMRAADDSLQRDLTQKIGELTATGPYSRGPLKWIREHAFALIEASYNATATPIWIGMYQQAVEKGDNHTQAVDRADRLIRRLFPQHNIVNAAGIVRDRGGIGFMLQFYGFQSTALQNVYSNVQQMYESPDVKMKMRAAGRTLGYFLAISLIGAFLRGRGPDKDEEVSSWALRTLLTSGIQMLPLGSDFANVMDAWLGGRQASSRPSSALTATIDAVARAVVVLASDKEDGKKVEAALRAAGPLLGLPTSQAIRTGKYVSDVVSGDRAPGGPGDVVSGLIYGESDRRQWTPFNTPGRIMEPR